MMWEIPNASLNDIVQKQSLLFSLEGKMEGDKCLEIIAKMLFVPRN